MSAASPYQTVAAAYERQNAECRNRLYADYMTDHQPTHLHPLTMVLLGAMLGGLAVAAALMLWRPASPPPTPCSTTSAAAPAPL